MVAAAAYRSDYGCILVATFRPHPMVYAFRPSLILWPWEIEVVFTLDAGHHPFSEGVPRIEAVVKRHPLQTTTTPGRGIWTDLPVGEQVIVDELPLVPGDIPPFPV